MRDTSSQQKTDSAPWEQAERLKCIIDGTNIGTWEWNVQTGETTFNERWAEIIGYRLEELAPVDINTWLNHAHPDDLRESGVRLERHFSGETPFYDYQCRMRHKSGRWVWVHDRGRVVSWTDEGKPLMMYGTHADITEMREQQDEAHRTSAQLQAILDSATGVSVIAINPDGLITLFNRGAQRLLGYQAEEVVGLQTPALIHLGDEVTQRGRELSQLVGREISGFEVFVHLARQGEPETRQWTYVHKDGTRRRVNLTVSAIFDRQGTLSGFLGIASDISELESTTRALQESENRFRGLVANLPGVVYRCENDANWTMRYMSDEVSSLTGFPASDFIDNRVRSFSSVVHPDDLHITYQSVAAIERHEKFELTYRLKHVDGHSVWVREQGRGEYDANGDLLWVSGFIWDISDRKAAEDALRISERRFSGAFNTAPQGIAIVDLDGRWMEVNDALCRMLGYSREELLQLDFQHITHPDDLAKDLALLQQLLEGVIADYQLEKRYVDKRGNVLWILLSVSLVRDALGVPLHFVSQIQDITDRFEAEKRLREREEYLSTLLDNVIDAIVTIDESGLIETFNPAAERIFGYGKADVVGQNVKLLMPERYREQHDSFLFAYRESGVPRILGKDLELPAQRRNGELFTMELAVSQITLQSQRRFIAVIRDISERKRIERMKNEFVSTVSHELRTPLTSIAGALGLINGGALGEVPAQMGEMLRIAQSNSQRLSGLINDLLDMDKLVAGKMTFDLQALRLWPLLEAAIEQNQPYAAQHSVALHLKPPQLEVEVRVDRQRFDQVMANLLSNAAKFSAPGADVEVSAALAVTRVRISVRDFGMGIPEAFRARIFGKFSQADATDTRQKGGTGLGLAITKELIERMAGAIGFESVEGQGTVFWVELPVEKQP
ncbi:PAS domain-containing sensor histidine kinase [Pseudomonas anguilliseptica]|uniref:PAS domain-containing sensor histidine kinase n=1 Tax=Pseudomonas anguilliseptica TaxID=53406 RepID=UPI001F46B392|nr:PAS domain S-box protein [Pseudomonas anguilliseptica]MCE5365282.1 PAS domain S-box protein [Pseudomonas anguilliseptica]